MEKVLNAEVTEVELIKANEVINIKQIPDTEYKKLKEYNAQLAYSLQDMKIEEKIKKINEENVKEIKGIRTLIRKEKTDLEDNRIKAEKVYNEELNNWKKQYKILAFNLLDEADKKIKKALDVYEDNLRLAKTKKFKEMFETLKKENNLDFIEFNDANLNIQLSTSEKELEKQLNEFIEKVNNDLKIIKLGNNSDRVMAEYMQCKDLSTAITKVNNLIETEKKIKAQQEAQAEARQKQLNNAKQADTTELAQKPATNIKEAEKPLKRIKAQIIVEGTIEQLKALKQYILDNDLEVRKGEE